MLRFGLFAGAALIVLIGALWLLQRRLIYFPGGPVPDVSRVLPGWQEINIETSDGLTLGAWIHEPEDDEPVVMVFNGNAGNRADRAELGRRLAAEGLGVLLMDYRGYGGNPGSPSEEGLALDAQAARSWVTERYADTAVAYFGESLGAAVAVGLATEHPPLALILRSPFTSLGDVGAEHYPFLPVRLLLWDAYPSIDRIGSVAAPVLVVAGSADSIIPVEQSKAMHDAALGPKRLLIIEGADHNDAALNHGSSVIDAVVTLLDGA